ncbi:uncharacterized protein JCM6883_001143 [Sporobolomyces salmoneus]|uniref:uncharacterized protein n=1 Tax=Sporobolomyces salmoneus TaxID=183962 RepID=UPI00317F1935
MSDSINDLFDALSRTWDSVVPSEGLPNLHQLPERLHSALFSPGGVFDKLTNGGTVPLPVPSSWLESTPPAPPSPPPSSSASSSPLGAVPRWIQDLCTHLARHPYLYALATVSMTTGAIQYYSPRTLQPLFSLVVPASLLPDPKNRPMRLVPSTHPGIAGEVRKEAVLVLGADSTEGREIALDLEKKGWVVIATVSDPDEVERLERQGRGWIKVLVLDPTESSSVSPFLRSLSTALSLRFPLHTSGDPFSRPSHALSLTSLIDCLSLSTSTSTSSSSLVPLEAIEPDQVKRDLTERIATFVLVSKGVLPFLRNSSSKPGLPTSVYLLLLPSIPSNVSLPFLSLSSTLSQSLSSLFHSLRRELLLSTPRPDLKLSILQVGSFDLGPLSPRQTQTSTPQSKPLPIRLSSLYAPALSRRTTSPISPASSPKSFSRPRSPLSSLTRKISLLLLHPSHASPISLIGSSSWTYYYLNNVSWLVGNHRAIDWMIQGRDWLIERYESGVRALRARRGGGQSRLGGNGSGRGPLPPLPTASTEKGKAREKEIPESLKPGPGPHAHMNSNATKSPSQVPIKDGFFVPNTQSQQTQQGSQGGFVSESSDEDDEGGYGTSSIEDLGVGSESEGRSGGNGRGGESVYITGSFVNV